MIGPEFSQCTLLNSADRSEQEEEHLADHGIR